MIRSEKIKDLRNKLSQAFDQRVRAITAGLSLDELRAVVRGDPPTEKPNPRYRVHTTSFLFHIRPRYYEAGSTIFTHTFRLGFFSTFFFFLEVITGMILMIYYTPSPEKAYTSILNIMSNVPFGEVVRDLHRIGSEGMVIFVSLHMLRTFLTGSYKKDRSFTWLTGIVLLGITLFLAFFGYLLVWDQVAYWAVTIGTSMAEAAPVFGNQANLLLRGAPDIGAGGLLRAYLLHVVLLPLAAILVISIHYYKVSREHGISLPARYEEGNVPEEKKKAAKQRIDFLPDLLTHEVFLTALGLLLLIGLVTIGGYDAPLENIADPQVTPLDTKAPWYFWWLQGMLKFPEIPGIESKTLWGVIVPTVIVILLVALPYIDRNPHRSLYKRPYAVGIGLLTLIILVVLSYMGTPLYGIQTDPATRIVQDLAPEEGVGALRQVPFEQLQNGVYEVNVTSSERMCPTLDFGCPELESVFQEYTDRVNEFVERDILPEETEALMIIGDWQQDLKKVTMRITRPELSDTGEITTRVYERDIFLHKDRGE